MNHSTNTLLTPQASAIYDLLQTSPSLTAIEIGQALQVLPNAVYRAAEQLIQLGLAKKSTDYPVRFELVPLDAALAWYMVLARRNFLENFPHVARKVAKSGRPTITFMKDRAMLLARTNKDAFTARQNIDFIVSGLEVPDETILAYRRATQQGVKIRALVQQKKETTAHKLEQWRDIGVDVRASTDLGIRLFVFDSRIVYFTSYSAQAKNQAFGIRFDYPPIAAVMSKLFEAHWSKATEL